MPDSPSSSLSCSVGVPTFPDIWRLPANVIFPLLGESAVGKVKRSHLMYFGSSDKYVLTMSRAFFFAEFFGPPLRQGWCIWRRGFATFSGDHSRLTQPRINSTITESRQSARPSSHKQFPLMKIRQSNLRSGIPPAKNDTNHWHPCIIEMPTVRSSYMISRNR